MQQRWRVSAALAGLLAGSTAFAQEVDKILEVKAWQGTLTASVDWQGSPGPGVTAKFRESVNGTFALDEFDPLLLQWNGNWVSGTGNYYFESVSVAGGCTTTVITSGSGPILNRAILDLHLTIDEYSPRWKFKDWAEMSVSTKRRKVCGSVIEESTSETPTKVVLNPGRTGATRWRDLPASGTSLSFTDEADYSCSFCEPRIVATGWKISVTFTPKAAGELELEIDSPQYRQWLPSATRDGGDGEAIEFTATLKNKDGSTPQQGVERFEWELIDTSREPGVAINWPPADAAAGFDMILDPAVIVNASMVRQPADESAQKVTTRPASGEARTDRLKVFPRDWGAWSTLRVTAYTTGGGKVTGKFKGTTEEDVRLPDREKGSLVATYWKSQSGATGGDGSDDEGVPEGDGNRGDGLSLYEEYRGFYENGNHQFGDPRRKDYFAKNEAGGIGAGGLQVFRRITGLAVHDKLSGGELPESRVINRNYSASPRRGDQHGVLLRVEGSFAGFAQAVSKVQRPSTPKDIDFVGLPKSIPSRPTASPGVSYASATVAHELLHTVNVYHHGEADEEVVWTRDADGHVHEQTIVTVDDGNGNLSEEPSSDKREIRVFRESGEEVTSGARTGRRNLGRENGQHAGWENCVMRYDVADTYVSRAGVNDRYAGFTEKPGARLCDTTQGIDVNADGRNPQSRYGPAASGRGSCKMQILVNDHANPPVRK